ncbi:TPA: resolvase [Bacillus mycoides]|nr:resolvase [Bacillus mycoides]
MRKIGYIRVSSTRQNPSRQFQQLNEIGRAQIIIPYSLKDHLMEYRAGIFCGEVEVVLSYSNYGIEFLKLFEHDGIHEIRFANIPIVEGLRSVVR